MQDCADPIQQHAPWRRRRSSLIAAALLVASAVAAVGQEAARSPERADAPSETARKCCEALGFELGFVYTSEVHSNLSGGLRRGTIFDGKLETTFKADLGKIAGWQGLTFYANAFQLHRTGGIKGDYVGGLNTVTNIEALPTTRLSELWLEQKFAGGAISVRAGQLAADTEFFFSEYGTFFVTSDWPTIAAANLPSGGPAYPLSTPGVRLKIQPNSDVAVLMAMFNGDPAGPGPGDPQQRNRHGLNFRVEDPPLAIAEVQFSANQDKSKSALASRLKLGGWTHFGRFDDQRLDTNGISLSSLASNGMPFRHRGNHGIYGIVDQQLYRPADGDASSGIVVFSRVSASPSDRNLVEFYYEGGVVASGLISSRPDDRFGVSVIYSQISDTARKLAAEQAQLAGTQSGVRAFEATLEVSYQAQIRPGWILQPLFQYIRQPAGVPGTPDATVLGVRSVITY